MALDGIFLHHLRRELADRAVDARVDKIYQPNRDEIIITLRTRGDRFHLLLSARVNSARAHFTRCLPENPMQPPMLCMLLRKRLTGARLLSIEQPGLERMLRFAFDTVNELGDHVRLELAVEIMGRYSNVILIDENGKIIDALKRVDAEMSSERLVLPGVTYHLPPAQDKLNLLEAEVPEVLHRLETQPGDSELSKGLLSALQGVSPIVCRELQQLTGHGATLYTKQLSEEHKQRLAFFLGQLQKTARETSGTPHMVVDLARHKPTDISFMNITQYGTSAMVRTAETFSELLDSFYAERDHVERMRVREADLLRVITTASERISRKIGHQQAELAQCTQRDHLRVCGDLLSANLYQLEKGASSVQLQNFYEESLPMVEIKLDPALTPNQNAQKYYKEYRKAKTAEEKLTEQIEIAQKELVYLDSVLDELGRAQTEKDLSEIRQELIEQGYIRALRNGKGKNRKEPAPAAPLEFCTSDGFTVLVGRNNRQNDRLTLKQANNNDIWFHTKNIPGSHTILVTEGKEPTETALLEAAQIAALHSRGKDSSQVPVDYTQVRHVNKPQGAKPGMVIYVQYKTLYVTPALPQQREEA